MRKLAETASETFRMGGQLMIIGYHDLREISLSNPEMSGSKARELVRRVLENNNGNVSEAWKDSRDFQTYCKERRTF